MMLDDFWDAHHKRFIGDSGKRDVKHPHKLSVLPKEDAVNPVARAQILLDFFGCAHAEARTADHGHYCF